jgi:hypothetical protein
VAGKFGETVMTVRKALKRYPAIAPGIAAGCAVLLASACSPMSASAVKPAGETDLSCAALIYAANQLVDDKKAADADGVIKSKYLSKITAFGTAHATASKSDANEMLGLIKIQAYRMMGKISSPEGQISTDAIMDRARKCIAS